MSGNEKLYRGRAAAPVISLPRPKAGKPNFRICSILTISDFANANQTLTTIWAFTAPPGLQISVNGPKLPMASARKVLHPELEFQSAAYVYTLGYPGAFDLPPSSIRRGFIKCKFLVVRGWILPHRRYSKAGKQECNEQIPKSSV